MSRNNQVITQEPQPSHHNKLASAGKAQGSWNMKQNTFSFQLPTGITEAHMTFKGTPGVFKFKFGTFDCSASYVPWGDADYDYHTSEYMLEREFKKTRSRHPPITNHPFYRANKHKYRYNPARPQTPPSSPYSTCSSANEATPNSGDYSPTSPLRSVNTDTDQPQTSRITDNVPASFLLNLCQSLENFMQVKTLGEILNISENQIHRLIENKHRGVLFCVQELVFEWWYSSQDTYSQNLQTLKNAFSSFDLNLSKYFFKALQDYRSTFPHDVALPEQSADSSYTPASPIYERSPSPTGDEELMREPNEPESISRNFQNETTVLKTHGMGGGTVTVMN